MAQEKAWKMPPLEIEEEDEIIESDEQITSNLPKDAQYPLKIQYCGCTYLLYTSIHA